MHQLLELPGHKHKNLLQHHPKIKLDSSKIEMFKILLDSNKQKQKNLRFTKYAFVSCLMDG